MPGDRPPVATRPYRQLPRQDSHLQERATFTAHHSSRYDVLDGLGAARIGGRWNPVGLPMVYASMSYPGALLEQLVHAGMGRLPRNRTASRIVIPGGLEVSALDVEEHPEWPREEVSREIGEAWIASARSVALVVPSVVARPWGRNVLLNPAHESFARVEVAEAVRVVWDPRLA